MVTTMHPDENLLAAFAERTLAPTERGRVLEHLSHCADCRDAVFLAQQAAGEPALQTALPFPGGRRMSGAMRWASASAAALLAVALTVGLLWNPAKQTPPRTAASGQVTPQPPSTQPAEVPAKSKTTARKRAFHTRPAAVAEVVGSVLDQSGAAIPGAEVSLRLGDAATRQATTDGAGHFAIPSVTPGSYTVNFIAPGFQTVVRNIDVHPQERAALSETLAPGAVSQSVTVSAAPAAAQPQTENETSGLRLNGRSVSSQTGQNEAKVVTPPTFSIKHGVVRRCVGKACVARPLPSASRAQSIAFDGQTVIVVDDHGQVWLSSDQGQTWRLR